MENLLKEEIEKHRRGELEVPLIINYEQNKSIELENKLPELSKLNLEQGRLKQAERITKDIKEEEKEKEKLKEEEELKIYTELQKKYNKEQNKFLFTEFNRFTDFLAIAKIFIKYQPVYYDKSRIWWLWNNEDKKWQMIDEVDLLNAIDEHTKSPSTNSKTKYEILEALKRIGRKNRPKNPEVYWIQFKDKIYDLRSEKIFNATPEYFITNPIPHQLGDSEETPTIDKIMLEWVFKEEIQNKSYIKTLQEILSYCFLPSIPIHRIFCCIGEGLNGKGTFLRLIENFVGNENKCATEIELLTSNRFESSKLYKKLVCIAGEIDKGIFNKTKTLKSLSGEDLIRFEFKGKDGFDAHSYAKIIIATNHLPETSDKSKGFYRRWTLVDFPNTFNEKKNIIEEIPEIEYQNFCKKAIRILKELLNKGEFENDGTIDSREDKYEKHCNLINQFIYTYCDLDVNSYIEFGEFADKYNEYLISEGKKKKSKMEIGRSIIIKGFEKKVKKIDTGFNPTTKLCIFGIKFKDELNCLV